MIIVMEKIIYLAGGCFWGVEEYFSRLKGVITTIVGYANGQKNNPTYEEVKHQSGHVETVYIKYDDSLISLTKLLEHFLRFVDPYSINKQGEDEGIQYRSGVYYINKEDKDIVFNYFNNHLKPSYQIEVKELENFFEAEEYHQNYLKKNQNGYCHVNLSLIKDDEKR